VTISVPTRSCAHDPATAAHEAAVHRAVTAMHAALFQASTLEHAASDSLYSRFHFHRTFRTVTGTTPGRFLACLRMQRAKELLAETELPVAAVSNLVGYGSLSTFTTQFRRLVGTTPGQFRRIVDFCAEAGVLGDLDGPRASPGANAIVSIRWPDPRGAAEPRTTFVGLFDSEVPSGHPSAFAVLGEAEGPAPMAVAGAALALSVPTHVRLIDLALGRGGGRLVGRATTSAESRVFEIDLRSPGLADPPVVSAAVIAHVARTRGIRRPGVSRRARPTVAQARTPRS
jgi:AraC-like DNA-binding protein